MLLTSCELKPHPRVPNSSGVQQGQRCSAFGPRRKLRQGSCLNYLTFAHLYFYLLASLVARCLQKKVNPSTQTGAPTKQNSQNSHDKHAHANLNIYIYIHSSIYIYIYKNWNPKRTIDLWKNNGSRKTQAAASFKIHVLLFSFQVIGESARFRVFRKMPSSHARRGEFLGGRVSLRVVRTFIPPTLPWNLK